MNVKGLHRLKKFKPLGIMLGLMAAFFFSSFVYAELSSHQPSAPSAEQSQQADPQSGSSYSHDPTNFTAYIPYAKSATLEADFSGFLQNYTGIKLANGMRSYALTVPAGIFQYRWLAQNDTHSWAGGRFDYEKKKGIPRTAVISNGTSSINTSSLVGYWRFEQSNGSAATNDSSGYGNMGTLTNMNLTGNSTSGQTLGGRFGSALNFDGVNDYVNVPDSANLDINETTISMWVYPKQVLRNIYQGLVYKGQEGTNNFHIGIEVTSGKLLGGFGDGAGWDTKISTYVVPQNQWVHLALVGKSNDFIKMYANGVEIYTASLTHGIQTNANAIFIGLGYASSNEYFNGTIDEVMVWNRTLTADEILMLNGSRAVYGNTTLILDQPQSDYPDNLTYVMYRNQSVVSNSAELIGYWKFEQSNGSAATNDSSGFGNTGTLTNMNLTGNATSGPTLGGRFGSALVFDGVNDNINAGDPSSGVLDFGDSANFTVSAWVRTSAIIPQYGMGVVSKWAGGLGGAAGAAYLLTVGDSYGDAGSPSSATFRINSGWSITHFANGTTQIADGNWHHLAGVRDGTNISIYVDGRLEGITFANSSSLANTRNLRIGISYDTATVGDFNGTIDEVRIYNRSLSAAEITEMYNQTRPAGFEYYISNTTGNANYTAHESPVIPLTIDTAVLTGNLYINGSQADTNYVYGQIANATATTGTRINNEGTLYLLRNGTEVGIRSGSNFAMNETLLGASLYNFTSAWVGSNYTFTNITYTLTIDKAKPVLIINNNTASVNTSGLVGYWRFEQSSGSAATNDSSGYGNMGTLTNMNLTGNATSGLAQGRFGNALNFDGVNDYVDVGAGSALNMTEAFTLSAWINPKAMPAEGQAYILSKAGGASGGQYHVFTNGNTLNLIIEESPTVTEVLNGGNVITGTWQHIAVTFNNVSNTAVLYINGVNTTVTTSIAPTAIYSDRALRIGARGTISNFNGTIDEVMIWNRTLTADEINLLYQSNAVYGNTTLMLQMPNKGVRNADSNLNTLTYRNQTVIQNDTGLVGYWNLDEGTGTAAYDKSGYGNTGTLTNINTSNPNGLTSNSTSGWNESGRFGYGLKFDGVNDYVNVTDSNSLDITGELTVTAWIRHFHNPARWHGIAYKGEEGTNNYHFAVSPDGFLAGGMGNGTVWDTQTSTYTVTTEWTHVAFVAKANDFNKMYANGVEVYTRGLPNGFQTNARDLVIGQGYIPSAEFFNGSIDEVRIYNRSLTAQEIIEMYNQTRPAGYEYYLVNTTGNANYTSQEFMLPLNISRATPTLYAGFNVSSGTTYGNPVLVYGNTSNQQVQTDATLAIRLNGSQIKSGTGNQTLGLVLWAGISEFNLTSTATANYTGSSLNSTDFNVSKSTPILALSQNNSFPTGSGLVGYWSFDENTSATAYDSSGKNNDGTLTDMGTGVSATSGHNTTDCKFGNCLVFDGVNDYVDVGAGSALNMTEAFTLSAWINPRAMPADGSAFIFSKAGAYSGGQYHVYTSGTSLRLILEESATITEALVGGNVVTDTWQHIAVTFNNVSNTAVFYINGVNTTLTTSIAPTAIYSDRSLRIGVRGTTGYFNGTIDEVRIYNYSMSAQQVMDSMNATIRDLPITYANATNITGFIRLGDNSTSLILDRNGTIIGGGHSVVSENKTLFGTGIYSYNLTYRESQNYTAKNITRILNVPKAAAPTLTLYVNGTQASTSWVYGQPTNATVTKTATFRDEGLLRLLRNGTSVGSGGPDNISESMLFGAGIYNYSATFGDVLGNYTNTSILSNRDVTIDKAKPVLIINNNTASVNTSGLVGYWRFEQSNGSAATNDSSGYGNMGTLTNMNLTGNATSGLTQGRFGNALRFDGVNDYVDAGNAASLRIASSLTLSAWVKLDGTQNGRFVIKGDGVGASTFSYILDNNAVSGFRFYTSNGSSGVGSMRNAVETTGVWYFVAGVYDSSQNMQYLYVDGVLIDSDSIVGVADVNDNVYIGRDTSGTAPLKGTIDEVQIWNRSLTADEINLLYQSHAVYGNTTLMLQLPNKGVRDADSNLNTYTYRNQTLIQNDTDLVGYWNLDEGTGTASYDKSGHGNTGTLTNMNTSNPNGLTSNATSGWNESGRFGYGLRFDGVNDFVNMTTAGISNTSGTFEFWIKPEGTWSDMSNQTILSVPSDTSSSEAGLTELWRLDEGNGGVTNGTKNKMNGTMTAAWVDGIFGNAIRVNGSSSGGYAAINDGGTLSGMTSLTVTAWLKPDRWSTNTRLLDHEWDFFFDFDSGGSGLQWAVVNTSSNTVTLTKALDIDKWVFVAGTYNGSIVRLFINGALVSGTPHYGTIRDGTNTLGIGCKSGGGNCHNGTIDEVGIYKNKALTEQEIRRLYLGGLSVSKNMDTLEFNTGDVTQTYSVSSWVNEWHHVSGTYSVSTADIYIDGMLANSSASFSPIHKFGSEMYLGSAWATTAPKWGFNGTIDEARIYNRSLTAQEIIEMYNQTRPAGYEYYLLNTTGNANYTAQEFLIPLNITQAVLNGNLYINRTQASQTWTYPNSTNVTATTGTRINNEGTLYLLRNGTEVGIRNGANFAMNESMLGVSIYNYTAAWVGSNYTFTNITYDLTINKATPNIIIYLNGSFAGANQTNLTYPNATIVNGTIIRLLGNLNATLFRNNTIITSAQNENLTLSASFWNYTAWWAGDENYTANATQLNLTMLKGSLAFNLYINGTEGSVTYTYPNGTNATATIGTRINNEGAFSLLRNGTPIGSGGNNNRSEELLFGAGIYNYSANASGFFNYTITDILSGRILTIARGNPNIALFLNGSQSDVSSYVYNNPINATAYRTSILYNNEGTLQLWRNGTSLGSGGPGNISEIITLPAGIHNYSAILINIANYTYSNVSYVMTIQKATPILALAQNNSFPTGSGLVGYWSFDENSTQIAYDSSGFNNDGTWTGSNNVTRNTSGKFGNALVFDGIDDAVTINGAASLQPYNYTLSVWIKTDTVNLDSTINRIIFKEHDTNNRQAFSLSVTSSTSECGVNRAGVIELRTQNQGGVGNVLCGIRTVNGTGWHHIVAISNATALSLYVDGAYENSTAKNSDTPYYGTTLKPLVFGATASNAQFFNGTIDEVRIYNYSMTQAEVQASMNATINDLPITYVNATNVTGFARLGDSPALLSLYRNGTRAFSSDSLAGWWTFNEGSGTTAYDYSGNGNTGTLGSAMNTSNPGGGFGNETSGWNVSGRFGNALMFDDVNDGVSVGNASSLSIPGAMTIGAWIKTSATRGSIIVKSTGVGTQLAYELTVGGFPGTYSGKLTFHRYCSCGEGGYGVIRSSARVDDGNWHHVAVVDDLTNRSVYIDGVLDNTTGSSNSPSTNIAGVGIGGNGYIENNFGGTIDDLKIYSRALSSDEVKNNYLASSDSYASDNAVLAAGIYHYNLSYRESQNYTAKNISRILNVPQGSLSFNLYINGTESSATYTYPNGTNATLTITPRYNDEGALSLLRNGTPVGAGGNNNRSEELLFGAGAYNYSANASGFTNYTISDILSGRILTITRGNPNIALFLNGTQADVSSYVYGNPTNATAFRTSILYNNEGTLQLWRNGTSLGSGGPGNISEILVLPAGIHNYSAILINIANYTYSNVSYVMTIQKATPILGIATNNSNNSGQQYGTVLYLSFDENASSTAYDSSGYGNDASWTGGANNVTRNLTGRFGNALTFDKKDDFITVADSDSLSMRDFTLSAWIKPTFLGSHNYILGKGVSDADEEYILAILSNGAVYFDWGWNGYNQTAAGLITANNWYHIAAVYTNSSNYGRIYIDGALINSVGAQDTGGQITGTSSSLVIGASRGGTLLFNGTIDEVKIYNYSRSTDEINASARGVWNDIPLIYPRIVNTTGFVRLGDSSAAINMTRNGTRISNGTANAAVNESILLAAGIYQYNVSYWESQNYSAKNISKILNIPKAQAVATLWFNESNADRNYNRSEWINATGFISTPQGFFAGENKLLNLTFNYTGLRSANFTNIGVITGANNTIYNITWNDVPGAYNFTLWFDGDQNYSAASVSHIASVYGNLWVGLNNPLQVYYAMNENVTLNVTVRDFLRGDEIPSVNVSMNLTSFWANSFKNTPYYSRNVSMLNFVGGNYSGKYNVTDLHAGNYSLNYTAARDFYRVGRNFTIIYVNESANANISSLFVNVSANVTQNQAVLVNGSIDRIGNIGINGTLDITIRKINPDNVGLVVANASALDVYEAIYNSTLVDTGYNVTLIDDDTVNANTWTPSLFNAIVWAEASYDNFFMQYIDNNIWSQVVAGKPVVMTYYGMIKGAVDMGLSTGWGGRFGRDVNVKTPHSVTGNYTAINVSEIQDATYNSLYLFDFHGTELADDGTSGRTIIGVNDTNGGRVVVYGPYRANHWTAEAKDIFLRSVYWAIYGTAQTTFAQTQNITVPYTFEDYFNESDGTAEGWNATVGSWIVQNNAYIQTANATADTGAIAKLKNNSYWTDYTVSMRFSMIGGVANNTQIYFRYDGPSKYYLLNISSNGEFAFYKNTGSGATNITDASPNLITISQDTWYTLNITARENKLDAEIGGLGRINATDASGTIIGGTIALGTHRSSSRFDNIAVYHHDGGNKRGTHYFKREWPVGTQSPGAYRATATFTYYNTTGNRTILAGSVDFNVTSNLTAQINITLNSTLLTSRQALAINGNITAGGNLAVTGNFTLSVWNLTHEISNIQNTSRSVTTSSLYTISETWLNYYNVSGNYSVRANYTWSGGSDSQLANFTISYNVSADVNVSMNAPKYNASTNATVNVTITNPMQVTITTLTIACNVNDYNGLLVASAATSPDVGNRTIGSISASAAKWNSTQWNVSANNAGTYSIRCNVSDAGGLIGFDTRSFDITRLNATLSINANRTGTNYTISDAVGIQGNITAVGGINASGRLVVEVYNASQRIAQVYSANTLTGNLNALNITALNLAFLTYRNLTGAYTLNATFNYTNETGSEIIRSSTTQFNISSTTNATLSSTVNKASYTTTEAATVTTVITSLSNEAITNGNLTVYIFNSTAFTPTYRQYWNSSLFNVSAGGSATQTDTVNLTSFPSGTQYIVANFTFGGQFVNTTNAFTVAVIGPATNLTIKFFVGDATNYMVYTTASGEVTANRTNASSEWGSRWIASFFNDSVIGLYGTGGGITVSASNTTTEHRINVNGMIRESRMYAIVTQGTRASFQNRAELLDASKFTTQINPSFGYPLREKSLLSLKLKYDDIDVQGSETLRKGTYKLRIENNGTSGGKTMIHIKTI